MERRCLVSAIHPLVGCKALGVAVKWNRSCKTGNLMRVLHNEEKQQGGVPQQQYFFVDR